ncbi:MetS family NSS transporter small subunit [Vibrio parahaemolyticus]|nr:MetS family NSS transporter small subunit [Vibrio sp. EA2]MDV6253784.1 MetS family NSS transporter small subunit [Vibrio sp. EA2]
MTTSATIMLLIGLGVTWGGAAFCIRLAMKRLGSAS